MQISKPEQPKKNSLKGLFLIDCIVNILQTEIKEKHNWSLVMTVTDTL